MTQPGLRRARGVVAPSSGLVSELRPSGQIDVFPGAPAEAPSLSTAVQRRILAAFQIGRGHGVLHLGAAELATQLDPTLSYWREIGKAFVAGVCGALDPTNPKSLALPDVTEDELVEFLQAVPPMRGTERLTESSLRELWSDIGKALVAAAAPLEPPQARAAASVAALR